MMKILQLYYKLPFPQNDGGAFSIYHSTLSLLQQPNMQVKVLAMDLLKSRSKGTSIPEEFIQSTRFESVKVDNRIKPFRAFINLFKSQSYFVERFYSISYREKLINILREEEFDIVQMEHLYLGLYYEDIRKHSGAKIVLRAQNVETVLWRELTKRLHNPITKIYLKIATKRLDIFEKKMVRMVDGIMALSQEDADGFKDMAGGTAVTAITIGMDLEKYLEIDREAQYRNFPEVYHLGSMDWKPNVIAIKWFVTEVLPLLIKKNPELRVSIAGKEMPKWFFKRARAHIRVLGAVEDAIEFQKNKAILIVPLLVGSGIRVKILEAMAMGKTIISTSVGARGINFKDKETILIANTPEEFAAQIERCMSSEQFCRTIGKNALDAVREHNGLKSTGKKMGEFYHSLLS